MGFSSSFDNSNDGIINKKNREEVGVSELVIREREEFNFYTIFMEASGKELGSIQDAETLAVETVGNPRRKG